MKDKVLIGNGQGFWGDSILGPIRLVREGPLDYLTLDYLAEVTMSIMQKLKSRDPEKGYATDFVRMLDRLLPEIVENDIKVVANAGGVNPEGCVNAIAEVAKKHGIYNLKLATVTGDDIYGKIDGYMDEGEKFLNMDTDEPLDRIKDLVTSANVYLGAFPIAEALSDGAQIVVTGRCTDPSLALGPMIHEFGWTPEDYDQLAAGTVAGHILECGAQATGGIYTDWQELENLAMIGYPIVEAMPSGDFTVTKHDGTGGVVNFQSVSSQLVYEMGDPREYLTPDVIADFTSIKLDDLGDNKVRVYDIAGKKPTDTLKVSMSYSRGWKTVGQITVAGPDAIEKAKLAASMVWKRLEYDGTSFGEDQKIVEVLGTNVCHTGIMESPQEPGEVVLRIGVEDDDREKVARFGTELVPLVTSGPPGVTGFGAGRPKPSEIISYWPTLISKERIEPEVQLMTV
ncbi:MAG: DUF1446 domain-containing protein [Candidatus Marinimicrobia bacterium]|nr:DUF1446 domain-containing protein [Candidatus Neomarinimicrobiota bacterium]MCF7828180.1 DUF1446 domain-containing protein [Candidatus Neomarinimicrobiota bacterium]MCF7879645.1 DUF1446 domain-containing protein [Candidatus Neomarinimicrobiota bacterium]